MRDRKLSELSLDEHCILGIMLEREPDLVRDLGNQYINIIRQELWERKQMRELKLGSTGPDVVVLQHSLNTLKMGTLTGSGYFGTNTDESVRLFQNAHGLEVDGIVGPLTESAIEFALSGTIVTAPIAVMNLSKSKLDELIGAQIQAKVKYGLGKKDPTPKKSLPIDYTSIDCSGEFRELIYYASNGKYFLPDGSWNQGDYLRDHGFKRCSFADTGLKDNMARAGIYHNPSGIGHVWMILDKITYESHGGVGPSHRSWSHSTLVGISSHSDFFELGEVV